MKELEISSKELALENLSELGLETLSEQDLEKVDGGIIWWLIVRPNGGWYNPGNLKS